MLSQERDDWLSESELELLQKNCKSKLKAIYRSEYIRSDQFKKLVQIITYHKIEEKFL